MDAIIGFVIVLISFFTLPVQFLKRSWDELSAIGHRHSVNVDESKDLPFLNWLLVLGRTVVAIFAILLYVILIIVAASANQNSGGKVVLAIIFGPLLSFAFIWFYGMLLEFISLQILVARNTRLTYEAIQDPNSRSGAAPTATAPEAAQERCEVCGNLFAAGTLTLVDGKLMCRQCAAAAQL